MITYLKDGWYTRIGQRRLRNEVVDGAIDTASMLFRAAVPPEAISSLAMKIRTLASIADPPHRRGHGGNFEAAEQRALARRLQTYTDRFPALQSFISDCLEHVANANELRALYLHLVHVTQMMQLLMVAKLSGVAGGLLTGPPLTTRPSMPVEVYLPDDSVLTRAPRAVRKKAKKKKAAAKARVGTRKKAPAKRKAAAVKKKPVAKAAAGRRKITKKAPKRKTTPRRKTRR